MRLGTKPPIHVATWEDIARLDTLSKSALMDIAWNLASAMSESCDDPDLVRAVLHNEIRITCGHRNDRLHKHFKQETAIAEPSRSTLKRKRIQLTQ